MPTKNDINIAKKISIMGTEYNLICRSNNTELTKLGCDGYCDSYKKEIVVKPIIEQFNRSKEEPYETKFARFKDVVRHEIIHAYFDQAGLTEYSEDETLVESLTTLIPKIEKSTEEALTLLRKND